MPEYIDPTFTGTPQGTRVAPWLSLSDALFTDDVLVKNDTLHTVSTKIPIIDKNFVLGNYGAGAKPLINLNVSGDYGITCIRCVSIIDGLDLRSTITPDGRNDTVFAIEMRGTVDAQIINLNIEHTRFGLGIVVAGTVIARYEVRDTTISDNWVDNVQISEGVNIDIHDNNFSTPANQPNGEGDNIQISGFNLDLNNVKIYNNYLINTLTTKKQNIIIDQQARSSSNISIYNNEIVGGEFAGRETSGNGMLLACNADIYGNTLKGNRNGIYCRYGNYTLTNNRVEDCWRGIVSVANPVLGNAVVDIVGGVLKNNDTNLATITNDATLKANNVIMLNPIVEHINLQLGTTYAGDRNSFTASSFSRGATSFPGVASWAGAETETNFKLLESGTITRDDTGVPLTTVNLPIVAK